MAGLYIHIPFCKQACHYCDFHFSTQLDVRQRLSLAIAKELSLQATYVGGELIETIYFGGGTPSLLSSLELEVIINSIHTHFTLADSVEITLEANPDDLSKEKLVELKQLTINRLSIGIQSFQDATLQFFNRAHNSKQAMACIPTAREVGFDNLSIDLIYGVPEQNPDRWKKDLDQVMEFNPPHISAYSLTIEDKTTFGNWLKKGKIQGVDENESAADFELLLGVLTSSGFDHYEISNFCKPGLHSRHNSSYWKQKKYLGVGPSAHSYNGYSRQSNISNNHLYIKSIEEGVVPFEEEVLTRENKINEYIFTTLRTQWGCDLSYLATSYDYHLQQSSVLRNLVDKDLVVLNNTTVSLTRKGKLFADQIAADLFVSQGNSN